MIEDSFEDHFWASKEYLALSSLRVSIVDDGMRQPGGDSILQ
jgi:hypothetical protein